jgi:DNA polymerase eta
VDLIIGFADRLWKDLVGSGNKQDGSLPYSVTSIALGFSGVEPGEAGQQSIEGFFRPGTSTMRHSSPDTDGNDTRRVHSEKRQRKAEDGEGSSDDILEIEPASFVCPRCHKRIEVQLGDDGVEGLEQRRAKALMEHDDFHVAEDLSKMPDDGISVGSRGLRAVEREKKKRKRESNARKDRERSAEGITKFLVRKRDE